MMVRRVLPGILAVCLWACWAVANGPVPRNAARLERGIFVPRPRGAGETLDADATAEPKGDLVVTSGGNRLNGTVLGIGSDGLLRMTGNDFDGEVRVRVARLALVRLSGQPVEHGRDVVTLTNDDRVAGALVEITPDAVIVETSLAGTLRVRRPMVRFIALREEEMTLLAGHFDRGAIAPWEPVRGVWKIQDGRLFCMTYGQHSTLAGTLEQKKPVTFVADVEGMPGTNLQCEMVLFASDKQNYYGQDSVFVRFTSHDFAVQYCMRGGANHVHNDRMPKRPLRKGVLRMAYDPAAGEVQLWVDAIRLGEWAIPRPPRSGDFVLFSTQQPLTVKSLEVLPGIVPPPEGEEEKESETDYVVFANEDRVSVDSLTLRDGVLTAKTPFGEIRAPASSVRTIALGTRGREMPRRRAGDVRVEAGLTRLTLVFHEMNADHLAGTADALGEVKLSRDQVRAIRFNIYQ